MTGQGHENRRINLREFGFHPLSLRPWHGMALDAWLRVMRGNWRKVSPRRYPLAFTITVFSIGNLLLKWASSLIYGRRLSKVKIEPDPIFIIGHWRSGTTWLHQIINADPRHAAPEFQACFCPETFLVIRAVLKPLLRWCLPETRPMDNVKLELNSAQEDEFGICLSGALSPYSHSMFPNSDNRLPNGPDTMQPEDAEFWRMKWISFLRRVQFVNPGKRLVLKSPTHTLRTGEILKLFPNARFIHIVRDPYKVFLSSQKTRNAMHSVSALQDSLPSQNEQDADLIARFAAFHEIFHADRATIPQCQITTVRYEDLKANTIQCVRQIYEDLDLGDVAVIAPEIQRLSAVQGTYENNQYDLDDRIRQLVEREFADYFQRYGYLPMDQRPLATQ